MAVTAEAVHAPHNREAAAPPGPAPGWHCCCCEELEGCLLQLFVHALHQRQQTLAQRVAARRAAYIAFFAQSLMRATAATCSCNAHQHLHQLTLCLAAHGALLAERCHSTSQACGLSCLRVRTAHTNNNAAPSLVMRMARVAGATKYTNSCPSWEQRMHCSLSVGGARLHSTRLTTVPTTPAAAYAAATLSRKRVV
jgi:hypothetical protein